ncbi:hypothetical protein [Kutzneria sp. NPDC051319]|uniref:hypothetical protein n=1 Tax=Kutzneria sp. NPDC051319 TaxID=3155047 RepID=UPI00343A8610
MPPHRLSLVNRVALLRRSYTGETDSSLLPAVESGLRSLTGHDRVAILETLNGGFETRLLGENSLVPLDNHIRRALLADATEPTQQQLEAGILFALGNIAPYQWPETTVEAPMPVCMMVRPDSDGTQTVLHLRASAPLMIATLLPRVVDGTVHGLAGLRARMCRRNVLLHLADSSSPGSVSLSSTTYNRWAGMLGFARVVTGHEWPVPFDTPVTQLERAAIAAGRVPGPVPVASALLRRLRILGTTVWLTIQPDGSTGLRVSWSGGRTAAQVATALVHPLTGLPGDQFIVTPTGDETITITAQGTGGAATVRVVLHRAPLTAPPPFTRIDTKAAWAELDRVMDSPHPRPAKPAAFAS